MTLRAVHVRLPEHLAVALDAAASAEGISPTGWARVAIVRALPTHSDIGPLSPSPRRRPVVVPPEDVATLARLIGEVGRATGATIQLSRSLREIKHTAHGDAEDVLRDLRITQAQLVEIAATLRRAADPMAGSGRESKT